MGKHRNRHIYSSWGTMAGVVSYQGSPRILKALITTYFPMRSQISSSLIQIRVIVHSLKSGSAKNSNTSNRSLLMTWQNLKSASSTTNQIRTIGRVTSICQWFLNHNRARGSLNTQTSSKGRGKYRLWCKAITSSCHKTIVWTTVSRIITETWWAILIPIKCLKSSCSSPLCQTRSTGSWCPCREAHSLGLTKNQHLMVKSCRARTKATNSRSMMERALGVCKQITQYK